MGSLLLGTAAMGVPGTAGYAAATTGLFGIGGQLALAPTLLTTGIGLTAAGQYQAGLAAEAQAEGAQAMAEYNARVAEREAQARLAQADYRQRRQAEAGERQASRLQALFGAAGGVPGEGVPLLIEAEQAAESELENLMIGYAGLTGAQRFRSQAALDRMQAQIYGQRARAARTAGFLGAGTTLLTGFNRPF